MIMWKASLNAPEEAFVTLRPTVLEVNVKVFVLFQNKYVHARRATKETDGHGAKIAP